MLESKDYYIDLINSSKANKFTALYHYSGIGFKKAKINQGIYRKTDNKLVGVLQWGVSAQEGIRLDRYVKEPLDKSQYLELNRFCMADSELRNAESQAISLGIKWIKQNRKDIKLLVSYAGRKEGNYGYIYQATSWEYLGYFISSGFWLLDGQERHQITVWYYYQHYCDGSKSFKDAICDHYHDVRQTWTKQFIYIKRLDKKLTCASPVLPYPKATNEYPICTKVQILKQDDNYITFNSPAREHVDYYYEKDELLFTRRTLMRRGELIKDYVAIYNEDGELEDVAKSCSEAGRKTDISNISVNNAVKTGKICKGYFFRMFPSNTDPAEETEIPYICEIDGHKFLKQIEIAEYCGVTKQAISGSRRRQAAEINGKIVHWNQKLLDK